MSNEVITLNSQTFTDENIAKMVTGIYGDTFKYCTELKRWLVYANGKWSPEEMPAVFNRVWGVANGIKNTLNKEMQGVSVSDSHYSDLSKIVTQVLRLGKVRAARDILEAVKGFNYISINSFDNDPYKLNCLNGLLDLKTGELLPHDQKQLNTKMTGAAYRGSYHSSLWCDTVASIFPNAETRNYIQKVLGYSIYGGNKEELAFFLFGSGGNGKGVIMGTVIKVLGDYATTIPSDTLVTSGDYGKDGSGVTPQIAALRGARLASCSETELGKTLNSSVFKQLTDHGKILYARGVRENPIHFMITHTLFLESNYPPALKDVRDTGLTRRLVVIPFNQTFSGEKGNRNINLKDVLSTQEVQEDVLTWLVEGWKKYTQEGLKPPIEVMEANREYYDDNDVVGHFIESKCDMGPNKAILKSDLYKAFKDYYINEGGNYPMSTKSFSQILKKIPGIRSGRSQKGRIWLGIDRKLSP